MTYSAIADTLSIVGFGLTCWVLVETYRLHKYFLSRARLPEMHADLEKYSGELLTAMTAKDNASIFAVCSKTQTAVELLKQKIDKQHHQRIDDLLVKIGHVLAPRNATSAAVQPVYDGIIGAVELIRQLRQDLQWSGK